MINSMFSLDHRLAELRRSEREQRTSRQLRDAAHAGGRGVKVAAGSVPHAITLARTAGRASRLIAG